MKNWCIVDRDDQIFIQIDPNREPVEFLLVDQPLRMIKYGYVTKDDIRRTVESNRSYVDYEYIDVVYLFDKRLTMTYIVNIDIILKIVLNVEMHIA